MIKKEYLYLAGVLNENEYYNEGSKNVNCDICNKHAGNQYVDGATKMGPWANMCLDCWKKHGVGKLGIGSGQLYDNETGQQLEGGTSSKKKISGE